MRGFFLLLVAGLFSAQGITAGPALSPMQVNSNVELYSGQDVVVRGYVILTSDLHALYESKQLNAEFARRIGVNDKAFSPRTYAPYCLTIANIEVLEAYRDKVVGKEIVVRGRFTAHQPDSAHFDMRSCPLPTAIILDEADLKARFGSK